MASTVIPQEYFNVLRPGLTMAQVQCVVGKPKYRFRCKNEKDLHFGKRLWVYETKYASQWYYLYFNPMKKLLKLGNNCYVVQWKHDKKPEKFEIPNWIRF